MADPSQSNLVNSERPEIIYGRGVLSAAVSSAEQLVVVTSPKAWEIGRPALGPKPADVLYARSLERRHLDSLVEEYRGTGTILGIGGGRVVDAAKYVADRVGAELILCPTLTSGNGPFTRSVALREGNRPVGTVVPGKPQRVVVDFELIRSGPAHLNRAGYGDILALETLVTDWRIACEQGSRDDWDESIAQRLLRLVSPAVEAASEVGALSDEGIRTMLESFKEHAEILEAHRDLPLGAGSEHLFAWNLEYVTGREFVHGEIVALGIAIMSRLQRGATARLEKALRRARVPFQPRDLKVGWSEVEHTLQSLADYNEASRGFQTVLDTRGITPAFLESLRDELAF